MVADQVLSLLFVLVGISSVLTQDSSYFRFLPTSAQQQQQPPQPQFYGYPGGAPTSPQVTQDPLGFPQYFGGGNFPQQFSPPSYGQQFYPGFNAPSPFFPFTPAFNPQDYYQTYSNVLGNSTPSLAVSTSAILNGTAATAEVAQPAVITTVTNSTAADLNVSATPGLLQPVFGQPFYPSNPGFVQPRPLYPPLPYSPVFNQEEFYRSFSNVLGSIIPNQTTFITGANGTDNSTAVDGTHVGGNTTVTPVLLGGSIPVTETHAQGRQGSTRTVLVDRFPNYSMYFRRPTQNAGVDFGRPINYQFVYSSQLRGMNDVPQGVRSPTSNILPTIPGFPILPPSAAVQHPAAAVQPPAAAVQPPAVAVQPPAAAVQLPAAPGIPVQQPPVAIPPPGFPAQPYPFGFQPYPFAPQFPPFGIHPFGLQPPGIAPQPPVTAPFTPAVVPQTPLAAPQPPIVAPLPPAVAPQPPAIEAPSSAQPAVEVTVKPIVTDEKKPVIAASSVVVVRKVVKYPNSAAGKDTTTPTVSSAADKISEDETSHKTTTASSKDATSSSS